jgi:RecJ-like exonuclease
MANYMFVLRPTDKKHKVVCPACASRGEVLDTCPVCHGTAIKKVCIPQYYVQDKPILISKTDRDPDTGILRYWESLCEYFYEVVYPELNRYVPDVPHGIHLCHDDKASAMRECERINKYLVNKKLSPSNTESCVAYAMNF